MSDDSLKTLLRQGLSAMKAGGEAAAQAAGEISANASHPALKAVMEQGTHTSKVWADRIDGALRQLSGSGQSRNPVLEALYEENRRSSQQALDDTTRDLGIVACSQIALHYWIAAFGTTASYTRKLGMVEVSHDMQASVEEARRADEKHIDIAEQLMRG